MKKLMILALLAFSTVYAKESSSSYFYKECRGWYYGSTGTFSCPASYMGASRRCSIIEIKDGDRNTIDSWSEEGCATGLTADEGYCVRNCRSED